MFNPKAPRAIEEMFGIPFTPAALIGFETMLADKAEPVVDDIAQKLASSEGAVHADETYWATDGVRTFFWVHGDENNSSSAVAISTVAAEKAS